MVMAHPDCTLNCVNYDLKVKPESAADNLQFDASNWFAYKPHLKEMNPLINLPYIVDGDIVISQTNACFTYLGRKFNMLGTTDVEVL